MALIVEPSFDLVASYLGVVLEANQDKYSSTDHDIHINKKC